jgi:hypothetical protein
MNSRVTIRTTATPILTAIALAAILLLPAAPAATALARAIRPPGPSGWDVISSPNVGTLANELSSVTVVSKNDAWAVGTTQVIPQGQAPHDETLIERWDGTSWSVVPSPNVGTDQNDLLGVAATSHDDAWAVGNYFDDGTLAWTTLAMHWDGASWTVIDTPSPSSRFAALEAVVAIAPDDAWAVGARQTSGQTIRNLPLIEHWDGSTWTVATAPKAKSDSTFLLAAAAASATDVWAVGVRGTQTLTEHFDGATWRIVKSPNPAQRANFLNAVVALSPTDAWAVGGVFLNGEGTSERTLAAHWNGRRWRVVPTPNQGSLNNQLLGIAALGAKAVWAVGLFVDEPAHNNQTLTEHWDGTGWTIVSSPSPGVEDAVLLDAAASPDGSVWAVGGFKAPPEQTLVLRNSKG